LRTKIAYKACSGSQKGLSEGKREHFAGGETQGERKDAGRAERRRESKETQGQPVQLRRDRYTGHIQDAVYVTHPGLASDIPGLSPRLPLLDKSPSDIVN